MNSQATDAGQMYEPETVRHTIHSEPLHGDSIYLLGARSPIGEPSPVKSASRHAGNLGSQVTTRPFLRAWLLSNGLTSCSGLNRADLFEWTVLREAPAMVGDVSSTARLESYARAVVPCAAGAAGDCACCGISPASRSWAVTV